MQLREIRILGLNIFYRTRGNDSPLLILHGWGGESEPWGKVQQLLSEAGYKVIVPDLAGFGKSDTPHTAWSVDDYVHFLHTFLQQLSIEKCILLGHSFGGRIAIKFSVRYPKMVDRLILCASAGIKHPPTLRMKLSSFLASVGKPLFNIAGLPLPRDLLRRLLYCFAGSTDYLEAGKNRETFKKVIAEDLQPQLSHIRVPTLLLWGTKDLMTPVSDAYVMKQHIPDARLMVFPGIRHGIHREIPEQLVKQVLLFLRS